MAQVMIVDDQINTANILAMAVNMLGHESLELYRGEDAVEMLRTVQPDFVLLDYMMPGMNGLRTLEEMRTIPNGEHVPIFLLTAAQDRYLEEQAKEAGATGFLPKPLNLDLLESILHKNGNNGDNGSGR
ncbi:MAG: response regulator [Anaerolineales bacterium]|nr:MAG: response regulator [Anaerolineales bacterium]